MPATTDLVSVRSEFVHSTDGLKLHVRLFEPSRPTGLPVVCLPGLTRTAADFDTLAMALAAHPGRPHRVIALDYRGRGRSDYDRDPARYTLPIELADVLTALVAVAVDRAIFVGTSRGGIHVMLLAAARPEIVAAAILNDIGPVIELDGLLRIKGYVGKLRAPRSFDDAAEILRHEMGSQFPALRDSDWRDAARRAFKQAGPDLVPTYDVRLADGLKSLEPGQPQPALWEQFAALSCKPVMVIRGALSDLLSSGTVAAMKKLHPGLEAIEVDGQGHAPLLADAATIARIEAFIAKAETAQG